MRLIHAICFCIFLTNLLSAQTTHNIYNIKGELLAFERNDTIAVVYYNTCSCHQCVYGSIAAVNSWSSKGPNRKIVYLIDGADAGTMRSMTSALEEYFEEDDNFVIGYDLNPKKKKRYASIMNLSYSPQTFFIYPNHRVKNVILYE